MGFQTETSVFKFLRPSANGTLTESREDYKDNRSVLPCLLGDEAFQPPVQ